MVTDNIISAAKSPTMLRWRTTSLSQPQSAQKKPKSKKSKLFLFSKVRNRFFTGECDLLRHRRNLLQNPDLTAFALPRAIVACSNSYSPLLFLGLTRTIRQIALKLPVLVRCAAGGDGESGKVSGYHADNIAPAIMGAFVLIRSYEPLDLMKLRFPIYRELFFVLVSPDFEASTKKMRAALPTEIGMPHHVWNCSQAGALVAAMLLGDVEGLLRRTRSLSQGGRH